MEAIVKVPMMMVRVLVGGWMASTLAAALGLLASEMDGSRGHVIRACMGSPNAILLLLQ